MSLACSLALSRGHGTPATGDKDTRLVNRGIERLSGGLAAIGCAVDQLGAAAGSSVTPRSYGIGGAPGPRARAVPPGRRRAATATATTATATAAA